MAKVSERPKVSVPSADAERPKFVQVGVIAGVCFAIGAVWPTLAGVKLVPEPPSKASSKQPDDSKATPKPRKAAPADEPPAEVPVVATVAREQPGSREVTIEETLVVNCRDAGDRRLNECDKPLFDDVARDRLLALASCQPERQLDGVLSIGFDLDFSKKKIRRVLRGKTTTFDDATANELVQCAESGFMSATLEGVGHTHPKYLIFYRLRFAPSGIEAAPADPMITASGSATVIWNSARLRAAPETGEVVTQLVYGTKVFVTARQGDWYKVKYDARGREAWVHKNALAL